MMTAAIKRELIRVERDEGLRIVIVGSVVFYLLVSVVLLSAGPAEPSRWMAAQYILLSVSAPLAVSRLAAPDREEWVRQMGLGVESPWPSTLARVGGGLFAVSPLLLASWPVIAMAWLMSTATVVELAALFIELVVFLMVTLGIAVFCTMGRWSPLPRWAASVAISMGVWILTFHVFDSSGAVLSILGAVVAGSLYLRSRDLVYLDA